MQMEIIEAGIITELIFIYLTINWFTDYHDRSTDDHSHKIAIRLWQKP